MMAIMIFGLRCIVTDISADNVFSRWRIAYHRNSSAFCDVVLDVPTFELLLLLAAAFYTTTATSPCPWEDNVTELQGSCICDYNLAKELSVQCDEVDYGKLIMALRHYSSNTVIDLLYVNDSSIDVLRNGSMSVLTIRNIQLSGCAIKIIETDAFMGQQKYLRNLNLRNNKLTNVPSDSIRDLENLAVLDLSMNKITIVPDDAFAQLKLVTLKLSDNEVSLALGAFRGLEKTLRNLNLKGTRQKKIPEALRGLKNLAFLDLSYNNLHDLPGLSDSHAFDGLDSLTGLNMERNFIQNIESDAFHGVRNTLSSLSLLSNLIPEFPSAAINTIRHLRVLDIGFNLISDLPANAFEGNSLLTLFAIDGNPLTTLPEIALSHLNETLRGLSFGGSFLNCDCKLRWILDWIQARDLQVTSREKPQFCGRPRELQNRTFNTIMSQELVCSTDVITVRTVETVIAKKSNGSLQKDTSALQNHTYVTTTQQQFNETTSTTVMPTRNEETIKKVPIVSTTIHTVIKPSSNRTDNVVVTQPTKSPGLNDQESLQQLQPRRPLVLESPIYKIKSDKNIIIKDVLRQENTIIIYWDTDVSSILGFRVIYRLFGDASFKQAPPLEASEREFRIKNIPEQECMIICVVSLEKINVNPANVPYNQCKEVRTDNSATTNMDKITIAASAAICATIIVAIIMFVIANRRRGKKLHTLQTLDRIKVDGPILGLPVNCCSGMGPTPSPGGPLSSLATLGAFNNQKEWDQVSAYSTRSIPRPRILPIERQGSINRSSHIDDARSQMPHYGRRGSTRTVTDGQSQYSCGNKSNRFMAVNATTTNLVSPRSELRQSRQSLAATSDRVSRGGFLGRQSHQPHTLSRRNQPPSHNRTAEQLPSRPGSRYSLSDSTHTPNNYEENNWTDHDMEIYMTQNPTARSGLVLL